MCWEPTDLNYCMQQSQSFSLAGLSLGLVAHECISLAITVTKTVVIEMEC